MKFRGKYFFLSNMYPCEIKIQTKRGIYLFPSSESAFQAHKFNNPVVWRTLENKTPYEAKKIGAHAPMKHFKNGFRTWRTIRLKVMENMLRIKFQDKKLLSMLLETEGTFISEENEWMDRYWGISYGKGSNHLGKLLMKIRKEKGE